MVFACPLSFFLVTILTSSDSPSRSAPSAMACDGCRLPISAASSSMPAIFTRSAVPRVILHAELSLTSVPSDASEMCLVSGPPVLVNLTSSGIALTPLHRVFLDQGVECLSVGRYSLASHPCYKGFRYRDQLLGIGPRSGLDPLELVGAE